MLWWITEEMFQNGQLLANEWKSGLFSSTKEQKEILFKKSTSWLKEVDSTAIQNSIQHLGKAFSIIIKKKKVDLNLKAKKMKFNRILQSVTTTNQGQPYVL